MSNSRVVDSELCVLGQFTCRLGDDVRLVVVVAGQRLSDRESQGDPCRRAVISRPFGTTTTLSSFTSSDQMNFAPFEVMFKEW